MCMRVNYANVCVQCLNVHIHEVYVYTEYMYTYDICKGMCSCFNVRACTWSMNVRQHVVYVNM